MNKLSELSEEYKRGFEDGYHKCMHDFRIVHGEDAQRLIDQVENPKPMSKEQKKFLEECGLVYGKLKKE